LKFVGYGPVECRGDCDNELPHQKDVQQVNCFCRACGLTWLDGTGEFSELMTC
jgi:hypothetical protein